LGAAQAWTSNGLLDVNLCGAQCTASATCQAFETYNGNCWIYDGCGTASTGQQSSTNCYGGCLLYVKGDAPPSPPPAPQTGASGVVHDAASGAALPGVAFSFSCSGASGTATSADDGTFSVSGLEPGPCSVSLSLTGYFDLSSEVTLTSGANAGLGYALS
jgi:hypothetical protein